MMHLATKVLTPCYAAPQNVQKSADNYRHRSMAHSRRTVHYTYTFLTLTYIPTTPFTHEHANQTDT